MAKPAKPPTWQKGHHVFKVTLPASRTASGKDEEVELGFRWNVEATKPMTTRGWTQWEIDCARRSLDRACRASNGSQGFTTLNAHDLDSALRHAVCAWCRTHLRGGATSDQDNHRAFLDKAPDRLKKDVLRAKTALYSLNWNIVQPAEAIAAIRTAVESLLNAASHPPKNRRRFPARLRAGRPLLRPRVKPGGWIDTGRYRPAQVLTVKDHPPHTMTISYGDEIDHDFRPHVSDWRTVRMRKRPPSLKEKFSLGQWIRHAWSGYGRVVAVRDSTMDVAFCNREEKLVPDSVLSGIETVEGPEPEDKRPLSERFPPGTWIKRGSSDPGVVIAVTEDSLTVLLFRGIMTFVGLDKNPVVWKLDRPPLDLTLPREQRRLWCWQNGDICRGHRPCPCCGYPNLGIGDDIELEPVQCIICGWINEWDGEEDADVVSPIPDPRNPLDWEWPNWGYSLNEARRNFEERGVMFCCGDSRAEPIAKVAALRRRLRRHLDEIMTGTSEGHDENWSVAERLREAIVSVFTQ